MTKILGFDVDNPLLYVLANIGVWVVVFSAISVFSGSELTGAVAPGIVGGLAFGLASLYITERTGD